MPTLKIKITKETKAILEKRAIIHGVASIEELAETILETFSTKAGLLIATGMQPLADLLIEKRQDKKSND